MSKALLVPVMMQMEALECGAASLCMVLAHYGKWLPLEEVRKACGVSRDGANAKNVVLAARGYGLQAAGYRMEPESLKETRMPVIIHWNFNHFVVLCGFQGNQAIINDPAIGRVKVSMEEFDRAFTGIVLTFEKGEDFVPGGRPKSVWGFARRRLAGARPQFLLVMATGIITTLLGILTPLFSKIFLDNIISGKNPEWLGPFLLAMLAVLLMTVLAAGLEELSWRNVEGKFAILANAEFFWHVLRLPVDFFAQRFAGDIAARQLSNETIAGTLMRQLAPVLMNLLLLVFCLGVMSRYSLLLTGVGLATVLINFLVMRYYSQRQMDFSRRMMRDGGKLMATTVSGIEMIENIKASGAENGFFQRWAGYYARQNNAMTQILRFQYYVGSLPGAVQQLSGILILIIGVYLIISGGMTIGMLAAFQGFMTIFLAPVNMLLTAGESLVMMRSAMERVEDVLSYPVDGQLSPAPGQAALPAEDAAPLAGQALDQVKGASSRETIALGKLTGAVELKGISFGYSPLAPPLIEDFSLKISPGASVAIVGGSGSGKSTVAKLIAGLYPVWQGSITFDGRPREAIDPYVFKGSVAMVDQEIALFEDTVADNIRMWDRSIEDFAVIMAARDAGVHECIVSRPGGYHHLLREGGRNFSGGQRQRLEIARVLAQEPTIIILDEATSALDARTEAQVMQNIRNIGATCIVIAHRLSTIRDCEEIIVLDKGRVVERGTHQELYRQNGQYTALVSHE